MKFTNFIEIIDSKGLSNKEVYLKSNLDRKQFSKIQCSPNMKPCKNYIMALCIGLELDEEDDIDLMSRADKAFNPNDLRDQYVLGFIKDKRYDIKEVNDFLYDRCLNYICIIANIIFLLRKNQKNRNL